MTLNSIELKAFVPAQDFELSKRFYREVGFTMASEGGGIAYFHHQGNCPFLLQSYYVKAFAENLQLHLLVDDVQAWWAHLKAIDVVGRFGVRMTDPVEQPWAMIDFSLSDPSGVCWRIGQNIPRKEAAP